jgi:hypothetical protein
VATSRRFAFSSDSIAVLSRNSAHVFAQKHALNLYSKNAIYTYIPKNACSTLRLSLAVANGCIDSDEEFEWIHQNNETFAASMSELIKAEYTFAFLRCPFRRIASVFLDKIIGKDKVAWSYYESIDKEIELDDITFSNFVRSLRSSRILNSNHHWRPQKDFLVYQQYDDYFCVEDMATAISTLKQKIKFSMFDAREKTRHGIDGYKLMNTDNYSKNRAMILFNMKKRHNKVPSYKALYSEELIEIVAAIYADDIALYSKVCDKSKLLFTL